MILSILMNIALIAIPFLAPKEVTDILSYFIIGVALANMYLYIMHYAQLMLSTIKTIKPLQLTVQYVLYAATTSSLFAASLFYNGYEITTIFYILLSIIQWDIKTKIVNKLKDMKDI